jgi:hypothetical protein
MPLPSTAFDGSEGLLYPHAQAIPADIGFLWLHISDDEPWFFVGFSPVYQQYTVDLLAFGLEEGSITGPDCPRLPGIAGDVSEVVSASWTERTQSTSAHEGMPSQSSDTMEQVSGEKPTISKSNDCHVVGDTWFEQLEHAEPMLIPCSFGVPFENLPRHRDSASSVEHTYCQNSESIREGSGIQSQSNLLSLPQAYDPFQDEGKAGFHIQLISLLTILILCIVTPLSQTLTKGVLFSDNGLMILINT